LRKPFYGWIIVGVTFLIGVTESGAFQNMLSVIMKPMIAEFGWSRTAVTGSIAFGSVCAGLLSPFVGPVLDRQGPRMVAFWSILILSAGLVCMTFVQKIWQLLLLFWAADLKGDHIPRIVIIYVLAALHGILHGGRHPIMDTFWGNFFGRHALGSIYGFASPFRFTANAIGPVFAALCFDMLGSYTFPFYTFIGVFFLSGGISFFMDPPQLPLSQKEFSF